VFMLPPMICEAKEVVSTSCPLFSNRACFSFNMVVAFYCTIDLPVSAHTTIGVNLTEDNTYVNIYTLRLGLHFKTHNIYFNFPLYNCDPFIKQSMSSYVKNDNT